MGNIVKEPVRLRGRKSERTGLTSLYLDIYVKGKRTYEYLHLYLLDGTSRKVKEANRSTMLLAESIKAKRLVEIRNGIYGFENRQEENDALFIDYFKQICEEKREKNTRGNYSIWNCTYQYLEKFIDGRKVRLSDINVSWLKEFQKFLCGFDLAQNTKAMYYSKLCACILSAYRSELIRHNPVRQVERIKTEETERMYLTIEEVRTLVKTPCENQETKRAFLFSCLTGFRRSDIENLKWGDIKKQGNFTRIIFRQKKTGGQEYIDITEEAANLLGERCADNVRIFRLKNPTCVERHLKHWVDAAKIEKHITFHCARHTFAVMMLDLGTDIYTVSKLLGHRNLVTTQIYAKVLDKNKQAAIERIPTIFE